MIRITSPDNDFDLLKNPQDGLASILYELGFDYAMDFVYSLKSFLLTNSVFDLLSIYIVTADNGVSIACASLLVYYDSSLLEGCSALLEKRAERYTTGLSDILNKLRLASQGDLTILSWLGYSLTPYDYLYNPINLINWVSSADPTLATANNYLKQGFLLFFVKEILKQQTSIDLAFTDDIYSQWVNRGLNPYPLGSSFNQSVGANHYV